MKITRGLPALPAVAKPVSNGDFLAKIKVQSLQEKEHIRNSFNSSKGFFGVPLDHECPIVICDCIAFLRNRSYSEEGVFRVPGNQDVVSDLKKAYNDAFLSKREKESGSTSVLNQYRPSPSVNDVASLMKAFFTDLPAPLIPVEVSDALLQINAAGLPEDLEMKWYAKALRRMPVPNRECFSLLISFLREIIKFKKFNQMTADNLATCFVLVVMGKNDPTKQLLYIANGTKVLKSLLLHNFEMKMPSLRNMTKCTKYVQNGDDHLQYTAPVLVSTTRRDPPSATGRRDPRAPMTQPRPPATAPRTPPREQVAPEYEDFSNLIDYGPLPARNNARNARMDFDEEEDDIPPPPPEEYVQGPPAPPKVKSRPNIYAPPPPEPMDRVSLGDFMIKPSSTYVRNNAQRKL